ncbi:MAG: metalloregulator ArsR/SmtB family transcription factor [Synergistota bacterium]|nr:metalloregulator ArsR/SmtB family transcription factor [Synergistota bacterium]
MDDIVSKRMVEIFKALAHPVRLRISRELLRGEMCVCDICELFSLDRTTISKHLAVLKSSGIVRDRKEGLFVFYYLDLKCLGMMMECISKSIEKELRDHLGSLDSAKSETPLRGPGHIHDKQKGESPLMDEAKHLLSQ